MESDSKKELKNNSHKIELKVTGIGGIFFYSENPEKKLEVGMQKTLV